MRHRACSQNRVTVLMLVLLLFATGCASAGTGTTGSSNRDFITAEEIGESQASNVYQLIQSARGSWLSVRGPATLGAGGAENPEIVVYLDGSRLGGIQELQGISPVGINSIQRLNAAEATQRFGTGHARGAILLARQR